MDLLQQFWLKKQLLDIDQVAQLVPIRKRFLKKLLLCVWWNFERVIHFELIPNGVVVDVDLYCVQLDRMFVKLQQKYPSLFNRKRALLQQDNAKPHTAKKTVEKSNNLILLSFYHIQDKVRISIGLSSFSRNGAFSQRAYL